MNHLVINFLYSDFSFSESVSLRTLQELYFYYSHPCLRQVRNSNLFFIFLKCIFLNCEMYLPEIDLHLYYLLFLTTALTSLI